MNKDNSLKFRIDELELTFRRTSSYPERHEVFSGHSLEIVAEVRLEYGFMTCFMPGANRYVFFHQFVDPWRNAFFNDSYRREVMRKVAYAVYDNL